MDAEPATPTKRPLWTRARLERVMCLRFGFEANGRPDTAAAAETMGVSRRTVQRWLHAQHGRSLAHIPPRRLEQLIGLLTPDETTLRREEVQAGYAERAIAGLHLGRKRGINPAWEKQRWLEQHAVVVLEIGVGHLKIRQIATSRVTVANLDEFRRRGRIVDHAIVPTRFHGTLLVHRTLAEVAAWRFKAGEHQVVQGFTQAWLADAPATDLGRWSAELFGGDPSQPSTRGHLP